MSLSREDQNRIESIYSTKYIPGMGMEFKIVDRVLEVTGSYSDGPDYVGGLAGIQENLTRNTNLQSSAIRQIQPPNTPMLLFEVMAGLKNG